MNSDGFTLTEMLTALMIASLAMTGAALAVGMLSKAGEKAQTARLAVADLAKLDRAAQAMFQSAGPFSTDAAVDGGLTGDLSHANFPCGDQAPCRVAVTRVDGQTTIQFSEDGRKQSVALRSGNPLALRYVSALDGRQQAGWPPADRTDHLAAIVLVDHGAPIQIWRVRREQPLACTFDVRTKTCTSQVAPP
jgi:prepilin-type N-terminal cleavage/methylation domain-containing protein